MKRTGIRPAGRAVSAGLPETGYYGIHLLKEPQWTPEIPLYFFVGGAAGSCAVIGAMADWLANDTELAQQRALGRFRRSYGLQRAADHDLG